MPASIPKSPVAATQPNKKGMDIAQSFGASSSYARKYALNGLFLIDVSVPLLFFLRKNKRVDC